jgi:metal-responsive CopG/Arc/MetJ family transcriptional regulator
MSENPPFENAARRAPEQAQISISLSRDLLERIDLAAKAENRNRSNFISTHLEGIVASIDLDKGKKKKKKKDRFPS